MTGVTDRADAMSQVRQLSGLLMVVASRARTDFVDTLTAFDLPVHLGRALLALDSPASMGDLAERLACDRSYITGLADGLEERGLVHRVPGQDRRVKILELTESGQALRGRITDAVSERSLLLRVLTEQDRAELERLLRSLLDDGETVCAPDDEASC